MFKKNPHVLEKRSTCFRKLHRYIDMLRKIR